MSEPRIWSDPMPGGGTIYSVTENRRDPRARVVRVVVPDGYKNKRGTSFEDHARAYVNLPPVTRMY